MRATSFPASWARGRTWLLGCALWSGVALLAAYPAPLAVVARLYHALCTPFPALAVLGRLVPPLPLALGLLLLFAIAGSGVVAATRELVGALRLARRLDRLNAPRPPRLASAARQLGIGPEVSVLAISTPAAFCYGIARPRIAISAGLLERLDDEELIAVLLHERRHQQRRDPLRYLALQALTAGLFMVPLMPAVRQWVETRIELAADRAALAVVPRGALAGALAAALPPMSPPQGAVASLTATEARIAHLSGRPVPDPLPVVAILATLGLVAGLALALMRLTSPGQIWTLVCTLCPGLA